MNKERVDEIVNSYIESLYEEHRTPTVEDLERIMSKDPVKGISATSRAEISKFVKEGLYKKIISKHKWPNRSPPLGYYVGENQYLHIDREGAELVRWIFDLYLKTEAVGEVAYRLNKHGISITQPGVWKVLNNSIYIGVYNISGEIAYLPHLQIVDDETFLEVRKRMKTTKTSKRKREPMNEERKKEAVDNIFDAYFKSLEEEEQDVGEGEGGSGEQEAPEKPPRVNIRRRVSCLRREGEILEEIDGEKE